MNQKKSTPSTTQNLLNEVKHNSLLRMITRAEKELNPFNYQLSFEAKKRLRWLYLLYFEQNGNVTKTAKKVGISRPWLSYLKSVFENNGKDPRKLEPQSKAPHNRKNRKRISKDVEKKVLAIRDDSKNIWGKVKITRGLKRDYQIKINTNTVNK